MLGDGNGDTGTGEILDSMREELRRLNVVVDGDNIFSEKNTFFLLKMKGEDTTKIEKNCLRI